MGVVAGGGQWGVDFFLLWQGTSKCQILILQIYQEAPPQLSQLNRQDLEEYFMHLKLKYKMMTGVSA